MSKTKPPEKQPERLYKIHGFTVSREDYQRYWADLNALRTKEFQLARICKSQNGSKRGW